MKSFSSVISLAFLGYFSVALPSIAQVSSDGTLSTRVTTVNSSQFKIEAGDRAGTNLFHSFREFSVPTGGEAWFNNALDIQNIFTRVTGGSVSEIDGLIRANGTANLFLMNPAGILFGQNAALNIGGSFLATTANQVKFADGVEFGGVPDGSTPLLTMSVPVGLQFGQSPGAIINRSQVRDLARDGIGLQILPEQNLSLVGGEIALEGGSLTAPTGRIDLGSVAGESFVDLVPNQGGYVPSYGAVSGFQDISLSRSSVSTSGEGGGKIRVMGNGITLQDQSALIANTEGNQNGLGIEVEGSHLRLDNGSFISASTLEHATANAGNLNIQANIIELAGNPDLRIFADRIEKFIAQPREVKESDIGGEGLFSVSLGLGAAGNVFIDADRLNLSSGFMISTSTFRDGLGGGIHLNILDQSNIINSAISTGSAGQQPAGNIKITTDNLMIKGGYIITIALGEGRGGDLTINAVDEIKLESSDVIIQKGAFSNATLSIGLGFIGTETFNRGNAGDLRITSKDLVVEEGSQINTASFGQGQAGSLSIFASESVNLLGAKDIIPSSLNSTTILSGDAGQLLVETKRVIIENGAQISSDTLGSGQGGNIRINASESINIEGKCACNIPFQSGSISSNARWVENHPLLPNNSDILIGDSGNIEINTRSLNIESDGLIGVSNNGQGNAGSLSINADYINLDNANLLARTKIGGFGNIHIFSDRLDMLSNSSIATDASGERAAGGNITIDTNTLVALENSDITANSANDQGGQVRIRARGVFGTQPRLTLTPESDITASSALGPQFNGLVELQTPDLDPTQGLLKLPENITDLTSQLDSRCTGQEEPNAELVRKGTGGLPPDPSEPLNFHLGWMDPRITSDESPEDLISSIQTQPDSEPFIREIQGWEINDRGQIELTALATSTIHNNPGIGVYRCQ